MDLTKQKVFATRRRKEDDKIVSVDLPRSAEEADNETLESLTAKIEYFVKNNPDHKDYYTVVEVSNEVFEVIKHLKFKAEYSLDDCFWSLERIAGQLNSMERDLESNIEELKDAVTKKREA